MKLMICMLAALCIPGLTYTVNGQELLTLEQAITIAIENNYDVRIARNNKEVAELQEAAALSEFLPEVTGNASTLTAVNSVQQELSSGQVISRDNARSSNLNTSATLTYTIFDGFRMFAVRRQAELNTRLNDVLLKGQIQQTVAEVTLAYYLLVQQNQQLRALEELMEISAERVKIAEARFTIGVSDKTDLLQSKVDLNAQKSAYLLQKAAIPATRANLNRLMARDEYVEFEVESTIETSYVPNGGLILSRMEENNPEVLSAKTDILMREQQLRVLRGEALPLLNFNSSYVFSKAQNQAGFLLSNQNLGMNYGFTLSVPLFRGLRLHKGLKAAKLDIQSAYFTAESVKSEIRVALIAGLKEYEAASEILALEEENIQLARENVNIALEKFRLSQVDILEVKQAQQSYEEAQNRLIAARYRTKQGEINLRMISGELVR